MLVWSRATVNANVVIRQEHPNFCANRTKLSCCFFNQHLKCSYSWSNFNKMTAMSGFGFGRKKENLNSTIAELGCWLNLLYESRLRSWIQKKIKLDMQLFATKMATVENGWEILHVHLLCCLCSQLSGVAHYVVSGCFSLSCSRFDLEMLLWCPNS